MRKWLIGAAAVVAGVAVAVLSAKPAPCYAPHFAQHGLYFDGYEAVACAQLLATQFPHRNVGGPNSLPASLWIADRMRRAGWHVTVDTWTETLYGERFQLHNVVATRPGRTNDAILFCAHQDHARTTIQGADNDASGVGILFHLAWVFTLHPVAQTVVLLFADGEEYGMLGSRRFVATSRLEHLASIRAAFSVDNAGKATATWTDAATIGQGSGCTPLGFLRQLQDIAPAADAWPPQGPAPLWQVIDRAAPFSFTDQGPLLHAGVPAVGLGARAPQWPYYHTPQDTMDHQSAATMDRIGRLLEAEAREVDAGYPPDVSLASYLYLPGRAGEPGRYVPGWAMHVVLLSLLFPFACGTVGVCRRAGGWRAALPHLRRVGLMSLPPALGIVALYLMARTSLLPRFAIYPAPPLDPVLYQPRWVAVAVLVIVVAAAAVGARRLAARASPLAPDPRSANAAAAGALLALLGLSVAIYLRNAYALLYVLPALYAWLPLGVLAAKPSGAAGRAAAFGLLLAGGATVYALLWAFGGMIQLGWYMLWYFAQMLAFGMIAPYAALAGCVAIGCGVTLFGARVRSHPQPR